MMIQLLILAGVLLLYFFFYYAFGALAVRLVPASDFSFARTTILGFFVYHFLFTVLALPMKVLLWPLSRLSAVWAIVLILVSILFLLPSERISAPGWHVCGRFLPDSKNIAPVCCSS